MDELPDSSEDKNLKKETDFSQLSKEVKISAR